MENEELRKTIAVQTENIQGLMENQLALVAQVQVLQAALASVLLNHAERPVLLATFKKYMAVSKQSAPQLAQRMQALEAGMLALLGEHQA